MAMEIGSRTVPHVPSFFLFPRVYGNGNVGKQTPEGLNTNEHGGVSIIKFHRDSSPTNMFFFCLVYLGVLFNNV